MPSEDELIRQLTTMGRELEKRAREARRLDKYREGNCPFPKAIEKAQVTKAYRMLMPMADAPWGGLAVDSVLHRLHPTGIRSGDKDVDEALWGDWQRNAMDAESRLLLDSVLTAGRAFVLVWPDADGLPEISIDSSEQMIVLYEEGSRRRRLAALRYWIDESDIPHATLYRRDGIYKFKGPKNSTGFSGTRWEHREVDGENWPLENRFGVVPVVEIAVNRRLKAGSFGYARGEFAHCTGLIDRINLLTFLGLVVAFYLGFPLRGVIGDKIVRKVLVDDNNQPLLDGQGQVQREGEPEPPFEMKGDRVFQLENPTAKIAEFKAAERSNLSIFAELDQFATITHSPRHYFPMEHGMANLSADAIRASEGSLVAKMPDHQTSTGEGLEEVLRLVGLMREDKLILPVSAKLQWGDHESRSLAERADAAGKLKDLLPWQALAEKVLNATSDEIARWEAQRASDGFGVILAEALRTPAAAPAPAPEPITA